MRRFDSRASLIGRREQLMPQEDEDVGEALRCLTCGEAIDIFLKTRIKRVSGKSGDSVSIVIEQNGTEKTLEGLTLVEHAGRSLP